MWTMCDPEDDFKNFMKEEIKRQILNGLGEACKSAEIEAVEVKEIYQYTASSLCELKDSVPEEQQYIAKTKLMVTVLFPVTLRAGQGPQDCHKPMEDSTVPMEDVREPERAGEGPPQNCHRPMEDSRVPMEDIKEPESGGLMEPEEFNDEPLFENDNSEEIDVPESEFYDFECDRSEDKFSPGQVWASYDSGRDVMPRDYVQIQKVMSIHPFKVQITLLEPRGFPQWVKEGNALTCGEFSSENRVRVMDQIDGFSHVMKWEKGKNGMICIYPAEREVWALYKDWKEPDPNRRIKLGYEIVQIVAIDKGDFTVSVVPLVNYKGSRTVFIQQAVEPLKMNKSDFVRFSHQISTYEILDLEGCMELDPAATPH